MSAMKLSIFLSCLFIAHLSFAQSDSTKLTYEQVYSIFDSSLNGTRALPFKEAVYLVENTYMNGKVGYDRYNHYIKELAALAKDWEKFNPISNYLYPDSSDVSNNGAIYALLKDTIRVFTSSTSGYMHLPYSYNFDDYSGEGEWSDMFVTKLLALHKGNCHSLPYLYKILADELGAHCWLALAPNHMYIKNRCKSIGWYNTELTSGCFPIDAWIMASGYLPLTAIQSRIYMDTLSDKADIILCLVDLAKAYEHKTLNYADGFVLKCCDLAIKYYPVNVQAILLKAETLKRIYESEKTDKHLDNKAIYRQMEDLYGKLFDLGYREMPDKMYQKWLESVMKEKDKYNNKKVPAKKTT
jgi:hypothetical protein